MRTEPPTQTPATKSFYLSVVASLERRAQSMLDAGDMAAIKDRNLRIAIAYTEVEPTITADTARLYRAAIKLAIKLQPGEDDYDALQLIEPDFSEDEANRQDKLKELRASNLHALRGAQQKAKWIPDSDWLKLDATLKTSGSSWAGYARGWIWATLITGLRPSEWRNAKLDGKALVVQNAKSTNGRSHGVTRTIGLAKCSGPELKVVRAFLDTVEMFGPEHFDGLYAGVRNVIYLAARETFPGRKVFPSLYTGRHCFAARAKSTYNKLSVAALMGHASTETAGREYAHARHAKGGRPLEVEPSPADVDAVRRASAAKSLINLLGDIK